MCKHHLTIRAVAIIILSMAALAGATATFVTGKATYFTYQSCIREGNSGITASGIRLNDSKLWCALPRDVQRAQNIRFGQKVLVKNLLNGATVIVVLKDTGPGKKARKSGTVIDLTAAAFITLAGSTNIGKIPVTYTIMRTK